jgi:hypothetical protein
MSWLLIYFLLVSAFIGFLIISIGNDGDHIA